jgi:glycosyltransferase involved in cell wall biosynthesis
MPSLATVSGPRILVVLHEPTQATLSSLRLDLPALRGAGYRCTFLAPQDMMPPLHDTLEGVVSREIVAVPPSTTLWRAVRRQLQERSFGLVHAHGPSAAAHAWWGGIDLSVPLVVTLHEAPRRGWFPGLVEPARRWLLGRVLARATEIVATSEACRTSLLRVFPNLRRRRQDVHEVRAGIDTRRFEGRRRPRREDGTTLIGYLGGFAPPCGFTLLLDAVGRLVRHGGVAPFHVVAVGDGDEPRRCIESRRLQGHVSLFPSVRDTATVLEKIDLVAAPPLWETPALTGMEALCAGVPVLGSDAPGLREVLADTPAHTVRAGDVTALETGLRQALARPWTEEAREFAPKARRRFDHRPASRRLVELLDRVVTSGGCLAAA